MVQGRKRLELDEGEQRLGRLVVSPSIFNGRRQELLQYGESVRRYSLCVKTPPRSGLKKPFVTPRVNAKGRSQGGRGMHSHA